MPSENKLIAEFLKEKLKFAITFFNQIFRTMSLINWRPNNGNFPTANSFSNMIDNFFRDDEGFFRNYMNGKASLPAVNIVDNKNNYTVEVAAPGMKKKDFEVKVEDGLLVISAEKETKKEDKKEDYSRKEFSYESFNRSFWLPENVDSKAVKATYKEGILSLNLPKIAVKKKAPAKMIKVA